MWLSEEGSTKRRNISDIKKFYSWKEESCVAVQGKPKYMEQKMQKVELHRLQELKEEGKEWLEVSQRAWSPRKTLAIPSDIHPGLC